MKPILATWLAAWREVKSRPLALTVDVVVMVLNNLTWVVIWSFIFNNTGNIRGWDLHKYMLLYAVMSTTFGIAYGLFYNCRRISQMINDGQLDAALTLPVDPLIYLLVRRINASQIGDIVFGIGVFVFVIHPNVVETLVFVAVVLLGAVVSVSFITFLGALTFHFGGKGEQQDIGFEALTLFSFYPIDMFGGPAKFIIYTVLPGAFVAAVPAQLVDHFELTHLLWLVAAAVFFAALARITFVTGLKKYRSGSRWTLA